MVKGYADWATRWRVPLGFFLAVMYLIFAQPTPVFLGLGGAVAISGLALRAYSAGYIEKDKGLTMSGPYAYTRNPLYLGSFLMGCGLALGGGSISLGLIFFGFFLAIYYPVMRREEDTLRRKFGHRYDQYAGVTPLFLPQIRKGSGPDDNFQWARYRSNREYEAAWGLLAGFIFLVLKLGLR